jgi:hypothetical protein
VKWIHLHLKLNDFSDILLLDEVRIINFIVLRENFKEFIDKWCIHFLKFKLIWKWLRGICYDTVIWTILDEIFLKNLIFQQKQFH